MNWYISQLEKWVNSDYCHEKVRAIYLYLKKNTLVHDLVSEKVIKLNDRIRSTTRKVFRGLCRRKLLFGLLFV